MNVRTKPNPGLLRVTEARTSSLHSNTLLFILLLLHWYLKTPGPTRLWWLHAAACRLWSAVLLAEKEAGICVHNNMHRW